MCPPTTTHIATAVTDHLPGIQRLAREYGVARLEVYGDAAEGELPSRTFPVEFVATYPQGYDFGPWGGRWTGLAEDLEELMGRHVSLAISTTVLSDHRQANMDETRQTIYAAS